MWTDESKTKSAFDGVIPVYGFEGIEEYGPSLVGMAYGDIFQPRDVMNFQALHPGEKLDIGDLEITTEKAKHGKIDTLMFLIESGGKRVCYATDVSYSEKTIGLARDCDLLVHEVGFFEPLHTLPGQLGKIARGAAVSGLIITHYPSKDPKIIEEIKKEYAGPVRFAEDWMKVFL